MLRSQIQMVLAVLLLLAALADKVSCGSTIIKVPPLKPGEVNQTVQVNIPPTVDVTYAVQRANSTTAHLTLAPPSYPGSDCLLSDCDQNDVGCDSLPPCGPFCPPEVCDRVNCSQCWQSGFNGPCCWSCCSQTGPVPYAQQTNQGPRQVQWYQYTQSQAVPPPQQQSVQFTQLRPIPYPLQQPFLVPQPQPIPYPQPQPIPVPQPQPIPVPQPQPIPFPQPLPQPRPVPYPVPVPQPQPIPIPQPRPVPYPIPVPQPYAVPQPVPYPQPQPQPVMVPRPVPYPQPVPQQMPQPECRQAPWWPFVQCYAPQPQQPPNNCQWYQPGCIQQMPVPNLCYSIGAC